MTRRMRLIGFNMVSPSAHHHGMWLHPETQNDLLNPERYEKFARTMEEGFFDGLFFADSVALFGGGDPNSVELSKGVQVGLLDPLALIAIMARATKHIGLGATISTSFLPPYQLARSLATLDVLSGGRIAWNVVTSSSQAEARNFGMDDLLPRDERYDRADEVLEACCALWNSWEDGAFQMDKRTGVCIDPKKVHRVDFKGKYVSTAGPLNVPRSPQGRPVIMQAGASERGREFAAKWAEIIFTFQHDVDSM
ncbi:MAG: NtaA/DmoA family FMN-dependent monooxygenase, partial [Sphingobium sp.]